IIGHTAMPVEIPDEKQVKEWLGERRQPYVIDGSEPLGLGGLTFPKDTEDMFYHIQEAMGNVKKVIKEVDEEYGKLFGRRYGGLISCYNCTDAKYIAVSMGAWSGDLIEAVNKLRDEGYPVGVLRVRYYRPFPIEDVWEIVQNVKGIVVFDRSISFGAWGQIYTDLVAGLSLYTDKLPRMANIVAGIAGVNVTSEDFYGMLKSFIDKSESGLLDRNYFTWIKIRR
ncbi:MAG: pyruvate ferredoxin oxidoreductase, partial [Desulfurococcaceae archaeon]